MVPVYDAKPMLVTFVGAVGVSAFAPVVSAALFFFGGSYLIIGYGQLK